MSSVQSDVVDPVPFVGVPDVARTDPVLIARYAEISRAGHVVLAGGSLHLPAGSCSGLVGMNGSGKSSLLLTLAGLLQGPPVHWQEIARGTTVAGGDLPDGILRDAVARDTAAPSIGYVAQHPTFPRGIGLDALLAAHGLERGDITSIDSGCLPADRDGQRAGARLSGGQRQRLAIAIALARRDPLVLLDEPFANVDIPTRRLLAAAIGARRTAQPAVAMLVSSHAAADLHLLCDRVVILRDGAQQFHGQISSLTGSPGATADEFEAAVTGQLLPRAAAATGSA